MTTLTRSGFALVASILALRLGHWIVTGWSLDPYGLLFPILALMPLSWKRVPPVAGAVWVAILIACGLDAATAWMPIESPDGAVSVTTASWGFAALYIAGALEAGLGVLIGVLVQRDREHRSKENT